MNISVSLLTIACIRFLIKKIESTVTNEKSFLLPIYRHLTFFFDFKYMCFKNDVFFSYLKPKFLFCYKNNKIFKYTSLDIMTLCSAKRSKKDLLHLWMISSQRISLSFKVNESLDCNNIIIESEWESFSTQVLCANDVK